MSSLEEIKKERIKKVQEMEKEGLDPYPEGVKRTHEVGEVLSNFEKLRESEEKVSLCGRVMSIREHGSIMFCDIKDRGGEIQIFLKEDELEDFDTLIDNIDLGDFLEVQGFVIESKTGEKTIRADKIRVITKSLRPLPDEFYGLEDKEKRFRRRYLDLILNEETKTRFDQKLEIIEKTRSYFLEQDFREVETPILQSKYGGAEASPFKTKLNALDLELYLRIAPELYLKRLLCDGYEKIFELGKNFRNEGMDSSHNPEFMMLEAYWAYKNWEDFMELMEELLVHIQNEVFDGEKIEFQDTEIDFKQGINRISFSRLLKEKAGIDLEADSKAEIKDKAQGFGIETEGLDKAELVDQVYSKQCQKDLIEPTFVTKHPVYISPLAKRLSSDESKTARFQLVLGGFEVVNAFSELNDPLDQKKRFEKQQKRLEEGKEAHPYDKEFIEALEYGMPPAAGLGIGLDRLIMILTDAESLREVIFFPTMRPKEH